MSKDDLLPGLMQLLKAAARSLVAAAAIQGQTGPQRVQELTGYSAGLISRWQNDGYRDTMPLDAVFQLEFITQAPVFARQLAALTGHRLVPMAEGDEAGELVSDLIRMTSAGATVTAELGSALKDNDVSPAEARRIEEAIAGQEAVTAALKRKLAAIKPKGGG